MGINFGAIPTTDINVTPTTDAFTPVKENTINQLQIGDFSTLDLGKGTLLDLEKVDDTLDNVRVGIGWDAELNAAKDDIDLDLSLIATNAGDRFVNIAFFNRRDGIPGCSLSADNRNGVGEGDDETADIRLSGIPASINNIYICVNIWNGQDRRQNFGMVNNAYVRLLDLAKQGKEICRFRLTEDYSVSTAIIIGKLVRKGSYWVFNALGEGHNVASLQDIVNMWC